MNYEEMYFKLLAEERCKVLKQVDCICNVSLSWVNAFSKHGLPAEMLKSNSSVALTLYGFQQIRKYSCNG